MVGVGGGVTDISESLTAVRSIGQPFLYTADVNKNIGLPEENKHGFVFGAFYFFAPIFLPVIYIVGVIGRLIYLAVVERREAREQERDI